MLFYILLVFIVTAAGTAAFILMTCHSDFKTLRGPSPSRHGSSNLLVVTSKGKLIDNQDELEIELARLSYKLSEKEVKLAESKNKVAEVKQSISKLNESKSEVHKYYAGLQHEIDKSEKERDEIRDRITQYSKKAHLLKFGSSAKDLCQKVLDIVHSNDDMNSDN